MVKGTKRKCYNHTDADIAIICNTESTMDQVAEYFGCGVATVARWRKKYKWDGKIGSKKGVPKVNRAERVEVECSNQECTNMVSATESYIKSRINVYCCKQCIWTADAHKALLSRPRPNARGPRPHTRNEDCAAYTQYKNRIHRLSHRVYTDNVDIINPMGHTRTRAGVEGGYQLDHVIPVREGFDNNISDDIMTSVDNLRMVTWTYNLKRNRIEEK